MFPEYRDQISQLSATDGHFTRLYERHNALDLQIQRMVSRSEPSTPQQIEELKKEKLLLKDQLYDMLKKVA
jgi:uncharacterized protein YdcH (DUF465 family)